jgi:hypothetical protein
MNSKQRIPVVHDEPGLPREVAIRHETGIASAIAQPTKEITPPTNDTTIRPNPPSDAEETTFTPRAGHAPCSRPASDT